MKKIVFFSVVCLSFITFFNSCSDDDDKSEYGGTNEVFLSTVSTTTLNDEEGAELQIKVLLTNRVKEATSITFGINNNLINGIEIVKLSEPTIQIKAGEREGRITIKSNGKNLLTNVMSTEITLISSSLKNLTLNKPLSILIFPKIGMPELTEHQRVLLEGYRNDGYDISKWIGLIPVRVKIAFPGEGSIDAFTLPYVKEFNGQTMITLNESSTPTEPILNMISNAMGIESYLYDIFRQATILDEDFWTRQPAPQISMNLVGLDASKPEIFKLALNNLKLNLKDNTIDFISIRKNIYDEDISIVGFDYSYSAWDRLLALIQAGNQNAIEADEQGGSLNPAKYLNQSSTIDKDEYKGNNWIKPQSRFNLSTGEMSFIFNMDHLNAGDYIKFEVTYYPAK